MDSKRKRILLISAAILGVVVVLFTATEIYRDHDYLDYFIDLKGDLVDRSETTIESAPEYRVWQIDLRDDNGLEVVGYLKVPSSGGPFPAILALGGIRTGKDVVNYLEETPGVIVFALDYPYKGKKSKFGVFEFISKVPEIRRALLNTVPATVLAVDYLLGRPDVDPERIVFVGGSVGAMYGPVVGAADERLAGVGLLFGAGDLQKVFRANIGGPAPLSAAGAWIVSLVISPLEPLKYVGRISPRPLFVLSGTGDDRMPVDASRLLHEAAREPKTIRWIDTGHVHVRDQEFHAKVKGELVAWLVANDLMPKQTGNVGEP
jgi:dienelactone hydrolase